MASFEAIDRDGDGMIYLDEAKRIAERLFAQLENRRQAGELSLGSSAVGA